MPCRRHHFYARRLNPPHSSSTFVPRGHPLEGPIPQRVLAASGQIHLVAEPCTEAKRNSRARSTVKANCGTDWFPAAR